MYSLYKQSLIQGGVIRNCGGAVLSGRLGSEEGQDWSGEVRLASEEGQDWSGEVTLASEEGQHWSGEVRLASEEG